MAEIESAARFALACQFALLALVLLRDHRDSAVGVFAALLAGAAFADQVTAPFGPRAGVIGSFFQAASISGVVWLWLLAKALFDDGFRWHPKYLMVLGVLLICSLGAYFYTGAFSRIGSGALFDFDRYKLSLLPQQAIIAALSIHVIHTAIKDWRTDLVESRRRFRQVFLLAITVLLITVSFSNYLSLGTPKNPTFEALSNLIGLAVIIVVIAMLLRTRSSAFSSAVSTPFPTPEPVDEDKRLADAIRTHMESEKAYTQHGLTVAMLARSVNEKEYRVRQVINGSMGYRNFNQFVNRFRIEEAARRLVGAETRKLPVLTIALDVGYASLAPFNRAFKAIHGVTPTEYRKAAEVGLR